MPDISLSWPRWPLFSYPQPFLPSSSCLAHPAERAKVESESPLQGILRASITHPGATGTLPPSRGLQEIDILRSIAIVSTTATASIVQSTLSPICPQMVDQFGLHHFGRLHTDSSIENDHFLPTRKFMLSPAPFWPGSKSYLKMITITRMLPHNPPECI